MTTSTIVLATRTVEVNEPGLGMHVAPGSAERFAAALLARIEE